MLSRHVEGDIITDYKEIQKYTVLILWFSKETELIENLYMYLCEERRREGK